MSINSLSTAVGERSAPNVKSVVTPSNVAESTPVKVDNQPVVETVKIENAGEQFKPKGLTVGADKQNEALTTADNAELNSAQNQQSVDNLTQSLQQVTESTNQLSALQMRKLEFSAVEDSGQMIVKVIDKENNDVIRQIPSEEFIRVAQKISDLSQEMDVAQGVLFDSKV